MPRITTERLIAAPVDRVFSTVADIGNFSKAVPHIVRVEFLSEQKFGLGTRFRETRLMRGKEATTELEVTEFTENERIRLVADSHGTIWDTLFTVAAKDGKTLLTMDMEARAYKFLWRIMNALIFPMVRKAVEADMDSVKKYCES